MTVYDVEIVNVVKEFDSGKHQGIRAVDDINLQIEKGEFFALLGPSGCGKTTTLRMIAGFEQPTSGKVLINGAEMQGIPPYHRPVNTVFQDYALFPHMTILQNVMFGLQMEGIPAKQAKKQALEALELVRLHNVGNRKPNQLSGGQQQRVALARALVKRPSVLLLDEPLGALDLKLRKEMQIELKSMQQTVGITFIYVTHDQEEALTMADRIAIMSGGKVLQVGKPKEIYENPASYFVADFIGETNFIHGNLVSKYADNVGQVRLPDETVVNVQMPHDTTIDLGSVIIPIRPERIGIAPSKAGTNIPAESNLTVLDGIVVNNQYIGTDTRYTVEICGSIDIVVRVQNVDYATRYAFKEGENVKVFWPLQSTYLLNH